MAKYSFMVLLIGLTSCGIYRQNVVNAPLMQEKGQEQIGGHIGFNGLEGQAAYALTNKIALLANYSDIGIQKEESSSRVRKHRFGEIGAGVYKKTTSGRVQELYFLAGKGMTARFVMPGNSGGVMAPSSRKVDYNRFVIQADFGNKNKRFEHVLSPRLLAVHYYNIADDISHDYQNLSNFHIYAEGAFTLRYHILKGLMISGQACFTLPVKYARSENDYYEFSPINASIGLIFNKGLLKP